MINIIVKLQRGICFNSLIHNVLENASLLRISEVYLALDSDDIRRIQLERNHVEERCLRKKLQTRFLAKSKLREARASRRPEEGRGVQSAARPSAESFQWLQHKLPTPFFQTTQTVLVKMRNPTSFHL